MAKALVIGQGSIGRRHVQVLEKIGCQVGVVSRRGAGKANDGFAAVGRAIEQFKPDYVVIANETSAHVPTLHEVRASGYLGPILVEKPLRTTMDAAVQSNITTDNVFVGYNLRFHPVLLELRRHLIDQRAIVADLHCGSFLPHWRSDTDYRHTASALRQSGGGVLYDLSHELDYALWLFGDWKPIAAINARFGGLEIETDDVAVMVGETTRCPVLTIRLNYLDRLPVRQIRVVTNTATLLADLITGELRSHKSVVFKAGVEQNETYAAMHRSILAGMPGVCCSLAEGERVAMLIDAIQRSAHQKSWNTR